MNTALLQGYAIKLVAVDSSNQHLLYAWRNQPEIRQQMVNQAAITQSQHQQWFDALEAKNNQQHYVIYYRDIAIGAINIRSNDNKPLKQTNNAEVGLYIALEKYRGNIIAFAPTLVINDYAFTQLKITSLVSKVRADNKAALKYNQQLGYELSLEKQGFVEIKLNAIDYEKHSKSLKNFLSRGK
jgi:RimJ/RimL family protein N-acetyltransferase